MPIYSYFCESCDLHYELKKPMAEAADPSNCPLCKTPSVRDYLADNIQVTEGIKTVGALADRNRDRLSEDHKHHIKATINPRNK